MAELDIDKYFEDYEQASYEYIKAKNDYRNLKAKIILDLLSPEGKPEGWKKPTEKQVDAMVDSNLKLQMLRSKRDNLEVTATACRLALEYLVNQHD